jgi:chemotaxis signal transduction protein/nucleoid-associated protein YgaU
MEVLLFTIDGHRYGAWRNQVSSVEKVGAIHRLPFFKSSLTVLAVVGDHTTTLADIAPCLGHPPEKRNGASNALALFDEGQVRGFLVGPELDLQEVEQEAIIPLPDYLEIPYIENFLFQEGELIPLIAVRSLFDQALGKGVPLGRRPAILSDRVTSEQPSAALTIVDVGESLLAFYVRELRKNSNTAQIFTFPLLPPDVNGLAIVDGRILPVIDIARRVCSHELGRSPLLLEARVGNAAFGFLVDDSRGEWDTSDADVKELPFICRTPWTHRAAIRGNHAAAIIDLTALLAGAEIAPDASSKRYTPKSNFPSVFGKEDVEVFEVSILGRRFAIPKTEVTDSLPYTTVHGLPSAPRIAAGVSLFDGELLPVLDLAQIQGQRSSPTAQWRMILVSNGNFRALVLSESEPELRTVPFDVQREVPIHLPYPVVYGCYTERDSIRLILNIQALALYFDEARVSDLLLPLSPVETTQEVSVESLAPEALSTKAKQSVEEVTPPAAGVMPHSPEAEPTATYAPLTALLSKPAALGLSPGIEAAAPGVVVPDTAQTEPQQLAERQPDPSQSAPAQSEQPYQPAEPQAEEVALYIAGAQIEVTLDVDSTPATQTTAPAATAEPPHARGEAKTSSTRQPDLAEESEEERFIEEVHVRKQVVVEQPPHRGRRMLVAFVASALFLPGVIFSLYYSGVARGQTATQPVALAPPSPHQTAADALQQTTAPQAAAQAATPLSPPAPSASTQPAGSPLYVVKDGDTLWEIAQRFTGDPLNYHNLAGRNFIMNPDLIFPGETIQIGPAQKQ